MTRQFNSDWVLLGFLLLVLLAVTIATIHSCTNDKSISPDPTDQIDVRVEILGEWEQKYSIRWVDEDEEGKPIATYYWAWWTYRFFSDGRFMRIWRCDREGADILTYWGRYFWSPSDALCVVITDVSHIQTGMNITKPYIWEEIEIHTSEGQDIIILTNEIGSIYFKRTKEAKDTEWEDP